MSEPVASAAVPPTSVVPNESESMQGTVKFFNTTKGFGFIAPEDGSKDVFVHITAIQRSGLEGLKDGDKVSFVVEADPRGRGNQAAEIQMG